MQTPAIDRSAINQADLLTRATHNLSAAERRLIICCLVKMEVSRQIKSGRLRLTASEFNDPVGGTLESAYEELRAAAENLFQRYIRIPRTTSLGTEEHKFRWLCSMSSNPRLRFIELVFSQEILLNLLTLRASLAGHELAASASLRSIYSHRLLELLSRSASTGVIRKSVADFSRDMGVPESYKDFFNLRKRVIEPAVAELLGVSDMLIQWVPIRSGRKVCELEFHFRKNPQGSLF